ncbi:MAG TPA: hypothetical protein VFG29_14400 [Syntrophales bacterium]|nr:hypothetical protein [Syntrophales bacterium]
MIKGKNKDLLWVIQGILSILMFLLFSTANWGLAVTCAIIFLANFFLIGGGSKVDAMFLLYPYGAFLLFVGGGMYVLFYYWQLFYTTGPQALWVGNHPGVTIAWLGFGLIGGILISQLSYTILFNKYVISENEWQDYVAEAKEIMRNDDDVDTGNKRPKSIAKTNAGLNDEEVQ